MCSCSDHPSLPDEDDDQLAPAERPSWAGAAAGLYDESAYAVESAYVERIANGGSRPTPKASSPAALAQVERAQVERAAALKAKRKQSVEKYTKGSPGGAVRRTRYHHRRIQSPRRSSTTRRWWS